jgi:hypothetical protein
MFQVDSIEAFDTNKEWLRTVTFRSGNRAFEDEQVDAMSEEDATEIAEVIMNE